MKYEFNQSYAEYVYMVESLMTKQNGEKSLQFEYVNNQHKGNKHAQSDVCLNNISRKYIEKISATCYTLIAVDKS